MNQRGNIALILATGVLAAGIALVIAGIRPAPARTFAGGVKDLLPTAIEIPGWTVAYLPIAETPEMKARVNEALNFDDAVFAVYTRGGQRLSVYIAYWSPGKMPYRLIAGHTPDVCWVGAGWHTMEARSGVSLPDGQGGRLLPAEDRTMTLGGNTEHVAFWHLLDGQPMSYGTGGPPAWYAVFTDLFVRKFSQRPEQFFIRISGNDYLLSDSYAAVYRRLMERMVMLRPKA